MKAAKTILQKLKKKKKRFCISKHGHLINAFSFNATPYSLSTMTVKRYSDKKSNVHLVTQLSCVFKTQIFKTNVNKENHTLDLTEIMQHGLLIKQFINLYIKLP